MFYFIVPTGLSPNQEKTLENKELTLPPISGPYTRPYTSSNFLQKSILFPPELAHLVEVWPRLSEETRQIIYDIALDALKDVE